MKTAMLKNSKLAYLLFCIPPILAYVSWQFFPVFAEWLVTKLFNHESWFEPTSWLWFWVVGFFYAWYTFLAIGVAGIWAVAATFARTRSDRLKRAFYPMVSLVVPAYNEDKNIERCIKSLHRCAEHYAGSCEIIVVDDGSDDYTYEIAWATIESSRKRHPQVRGRVVRHSVNLGKVEAIRTGVDRALGSFIAVVDADSWWMPDTLIQLVDYMLSNGKKAVTGYVHPSDGDSELNPYVVLQQLEYSQGLGITRQAQSLGSNVLVVSGAIGLYDADLFREILRDKNVFSVTEDLEITLEMHKRGGGVGYISVATSSSVVPHSFNVLWNQRLRWFTGWLHNTLRIHKDLLLKKSWLTLLLWYCYIFEYGGAFIDLAALLAFPFLFWYSPNPIFFVASLLVFVPYSLLIGMVNQAIALKYAYNQHNYRALLSYTPFYPILRLINILARLTSSMKFLLGSNGSWHHAK
jgi:cellulose synthase/poly-beta-1,6-N-acetylglucosamine synthase-like glycosyltransferase